ANTSQRRSSCDSDAIPPSRQRGSAVWGGTSFRKKKNILKEIKIFSFSVFFFSLADLMLTSTAAEALNHCDAKQYLRRATDQLSLVQLSRRTTPPVTTTARSAPDQAACQARETSCNARCSCERCVMRTRLQTRLSA